MLGKYAGWSVCQLSCLPTQPALHQGVEWVQRLTVWCQMSHRQKADTWKTATNKEEPENRLEKKKQDLCSEWRYSSTSTRFYLTASTWLWPLLIAYKAPQDNVQACHRAPLPGLPHPNTPHTPHPIPDLFSGKLIPLSVRCRGDQHPRQSAFHYSGPQCSFHKLSQAVGLKESRVLGFGLCKHTDVQDEQVEALLLSAK